MSLEVKNEMKLENVIWNSPWVELSVDLEEVLRSLNGDVLDVRRDLRAIETKLIELVESDKLNGNQKKDAQGLLTRVRRDQALLNQPGFYKPHDAKSDQVGTHF